MSETPPTPNAGTGAPGDNSAPSLRVLAQYLKDHSFENPNAPQSFTDTGEQPGMNVSVDTNARTLGQDQYEVELSVSARALRGEDVAFVIETTYAGAFEIKNVPQEQMEAVLMVECPRLLFPFIRQIIAETTTAGNFPPIMLDPIDFFAVYQQQKAKAATQTA